MPVVQCAAGTCGPRTPRIQLPVTPACTPRRGPSHPCSAPNTFHVSSSRFLSGCRYPGPPGGVFASPGSGVRLSHHACPGRSRRHPRRAGACSRVLRPRTRRSPRGAGASDRHVVGVGRGSSGTEIEPRRDAQFSLEHQHPSVRTLEATQEPTVRPTSSVGSYAGRRTCCRVGGQDRNKRTKPHQGPVRTARAEHSPASSHRAHVTPPAGQQ